MKFSAQCLGNGKAYPLLFSRSVVFDSLPPHGLQHARLPCLHHPLELIQRPTPSAGYYGSGISYLEPLVTCVSEFIHYCIFRKVI